MRLDSKTRAYVIEYREPTDRIPSEATLLVDHRRFDVGEVYYTIGTDLYIADHTGSDVDEWAIRYYSFVDAEDADPSNEDIIAMLTAEAPARPKPQMTLCDCGHYTESPMSASMGSSCPNCYDRMSG